MTTTRNYDFLNRLQAIASNPGGTPSPASVSFNYQYNTANQRVRSTLVDSSYWVYQYDSLGQVISGKKYWRDGMPVAGQQFCYTFDNIGNRTQTQSGGDQNGGSLRSANYSANNLNQYTNRDVVSCVDIKGISVATNTVTVNGMSVYRRSEYFRKEIPVSNSGSALWYSITVAATGQASVTGNLFVPQTPEQFSYDADGNLTSDGRWTYTWDGENRLTNMTSLSTAPAGSKLRLDFTYDSKGRRIQKVVWTNNGTINVPQYTNRFVYDGWNLIGEVGTSGSLVRSYVWGLDLSGSIQGAGGVGGLLGVSYYGTQTTNCFAAFDGNGNLSGLVNAADGTVAARYEYGPFGEVIRATGPIAKANPFRFSTKYQDDESDLVYYPPGRYYSPSWGGWLSRDPVNEPGFAVVAGDELTDEVDSASDGNLYGFVKNNPINSVDLFGLETCNLCGPDVTQPLTALLGKVDTVWKSWTPAQQKAACKGFTSFKKDPTRGNQPAFLNAWDIDQLHYQSWINTSPYSPPCATPQSVCRNTVQVGKQCYYAGSVNYVLFGHDCKLCKIAKWKMDFLIWLYKGPGPINSGSPNYGPSLDWANAGYDGWPTGGTPPAGDRPNCKPACPVSYSGPAFKFYWYPNGWN